MNSRFNDELGLGSSDEESGSEDSESTSERVGENGLTQSDFSKLCASLEQSNQDKEAADRSASKAEERVHQLLQMSKSARAILISNHKKNLKQFISSLEDHKQSMTDAADRFAEYKKYFAKIDPSSESVMAEVAASRNLHRENVSNRYKQKELEIAVAALQLNLIEVEKDKKIFKSAVDGTHVDPVAKELAAVEKKKQKLATAVQEKDIELMKVKAKLNLLRSEDEKNLSSRASETDAEKQQLLQEFAELKSQVAASQDRKNEVQTAAERAQSKLEGLERELAFCKDEAAGEKADGEGPFADVGGGKPGDKDEMIKTLEAEREKSFKALQAVEQEVKNTEKQLAALKSKAKDKLELASSTISKLKTEYSSLKESCSKEKKNIEKYKQEQSTLQRQRSRLAGAAKEQNQRMQVFVDKAKGMRAVIEEMKSDVKAAGRMEDISPAFERALQDWWVQKEAKHKRLVADYQEEMAMRRHYFNLIQELKGNIRVYCRVRPIAERDKQNPSDIGAITYPSVGEMVVHNAARGNSTSFEFEKIFEPDVNQAQVYAEVADLIVSVLDGYNVCIFAYGQTGSGKTYTMEGPAHDRGVNHRALQSVFEVGQSRLPDVEYTIDITLLEIYNEAIKDLLGPHDRELKATKGKHGMEVPDLTKVPVNSVDDVLSWMKKGAKKRHTASTGMNDRSSRSHLVLSVYVKGFNTITKQTISGKLHLIDLAGSERISRSGVTGDQLKEAQKINYSLSALGNCIQARANNQGHVPYRDSTLTYLLQDSLEKNSKTLMFVQISPAASDVTETICSLNFAARVRLVELGKAEKNTGSRGKPGSRKAK
mmetsp:Transcript_7240/g.13732  ORF Transcript_7240/g.13732 Transcript_7240/m.13732 type:complete len:826 (-) Transcript_7240:210-2687(-)|eukprot:CAMPEP_0175128466 /NCGR_PEP_ID=MMETSP0087-20121206/4942_1 /TAXON_ID=136419 /ORGANISM="Unknown Unknown, Strain D1" /LENGTH=825 /DNA_ID=CAMNT_0016410527 /DNA_START=83 /DNA_END=2560 /DNA_ORIENTATION=+